MPGIGVIVIDILTPLPDIAGHIVETQTVGRLRPHSMCTTSAVVAIPSNPVHITAPGILLTLSPASCRILPFRLGGQTKRFAPGASPLQSLDEILTIIPGNTLHWIIRASVKLRRIGAHDLFPLPLGHLSLPHPEPVHTNLVLRGLVIVTVIVLTNTMTGETWSHAGVAGKDQAPREQQLSLSRLKNNLRAYLGQSVRLEGVFDYIYP
jgi:hypothetical protein